MPIIFKAKTNSAYTIKILAELLQNNIKTACFEVDENGIKHVLKTPQQLWKFLKQYDGK